MSALVILVALFTGGDILLTRLVNSASTSASGPIWPDAPLSAQSSFYYADYKVPQVHKSKFLPDMPNCPQTGRTVCSDIAKYPVEQVFDVIQSAKARRFNFSSMFMDESSNDMEPDLKPKPTYAKPTGKAYIVYQTTLPVVPIRYVNQQNGRYAGQGPISTTSSSRSRTPTHQIVFPSPTPNYQHTYQYQPSAGSLLPPPVPTQNYQQTSVQTPASSYGTHTPQPQHQTSFLESGNSGNRNYFLSSSHPPATSGQYDPRSFLSKSTSDPYNLPPPPPPPPPPTSWKPMYPSSTSDPGLKGKVSSSGSGYDSSLGGEYTTQEKESSGRYKRQAEDEEVESVCRTQMQFISPKVALNDKAEWKYIVNIGERDPRLKQIIKVDVCSNANEPCSNQISLPFGFVSRCKQKYIKKKLLSLDPDGQGTSSENFFVPSCCVCEIVRVNAKKKK